MSKRLGKGLDALIPSLSIDEDEKVIEIPLNQLRANPYQPRKTFDEESIKELAESIRQHGVIQPIIVRSVLNVITSYSIHYTKLYEIRAISITC